MTYSSSLKVRLPILIANLLLGVIPGFSLFIWIERNCQLPLHKLGLPWPFFRFSDQPTVLLLLWNALLYAMFGIPHTILAQPISHKFLQKIFPAQTIRTVFVIATAITCVWIMGAWQHTRIMIWSLPLSSYTNDVISLILFWIFMSLALMIMIRFDIFDLFGQKQIFAKSSDVVRTEGSQQLLTTGLYGWVRHPMYAFFICAFLITPEMTLDRLWITILTLVYLSSMGIPYEEKKLVKIFGEAYLEYQKTVPAVIPFTFRRSKPSQKVE